MPRSFRLLSVTSAAAFFLLVWTTVPASAAEPASPVEGFDIHVQAPHLMPNGEPGGPFHPYGKGISDRISQSLLFEPTDPKPNLLAIEYFASKVLTRKLPPIQGNRHFTDNKVEFPTGE